MYNIIMFNFFKIFFITFLFFSISLFAQAQIPGIGEAISFDISPENPRPGQIVTIDIESFSVDLDRADSITWVLDGATIKRGAGIKQVQFEAGNLGSRSVIDVIIRAMNGNTIKESITIRPTEVDLLWETDSYTPPFYKGKALSSSDAEITIVAIPQFVTSNGSKLNSSDLIFKWKMDGKALGSLSGRGRDSIKIKGPKMFKSMLIQADVSSIDSALAGKGFEVISPVSPKIVFYENDPILGMKYENALNGRFSLLKEEVNITAHPYFFSGSKRVISDFDYSWKVNGSEVVASPDDESSIVLRQVGAGEGEASVSLDIQNLDRILQSARASFSLIFGGIGKDTLFDF
jgi:hypothetical protein